MTIRADCTTGITITLATSSTTFYLTDATPPSLEVEPLNATHHGSAVGTQIATKRPEEYKFSDILRIGDADIEFWFDKNYDPADDLAVSQSITWTFPLQSGETTNATWVYTGGLYRYTPGNMAVGGLHSGTGSFKCLEGDVVITAAT